MDRITKEQRRRNMQSVKNKGSEIETILGKKLWSIGYRYRKNVNNILGKPDFVFRKLKVAIFCDSEFWHGKNWLVQKHSIKSNIEFWHRKIEGNMFRDQKVTKLLSDNGWIVLRFWGKDIKKNLNSVICKIEKTIKCREQN